MFPVWIGIACNLLMAAINLGCIDHDGKPVRMWMKMQGYLLGGIWIAMLAWTIFNYASRP